MHDIQFMHVLDAVDDLLKDLARRWFAKSTSPSVVLFIFDDMVEEFAVGSVLHDQQQVLGRFDQLVQLDDVGMAHQFQNVDLAGDALDVGSVDYARLVEDFNGYGFVCRDVNSCLHFAEGALAQRLPA